ncbi:MAG: hypothetical protein AB1704_29290 [Pseudomonadota bacterium]|uniref:hypothetical protein n=1 Tax=Burkholderiaceae TaxID=119060 RepID=UPI0014858C25
MLTFFAAAKKVSAAPHRGNANRPIRKQGKANALGTTTKPKAPQAKKTSSLLQGKKTLKPLLHGQPKNPLPPPSLPSILHRKTPNRTLTPPNLKRERPPPANLLNISPYEIGKNKIPSQSIELHRTQPLPGGEPNPPPWGFEFMRPIPVMNIRGHLAPAAQPINHACGQKTRHHHSHANGHPNPKVRPQSIERPHCSIDQRTQHRQPNNDRHFSSPCKTNRPSACHDAPAKHTATHHRVTRQSAQQQKTQSRRR